MGEPVYCWQCEKAHDLSQPCLQMEIKAGIGGRYELETVGGWMPHTTMEPDDIGDWCRWEDVVRFVAERDREQQAVGIGTAAKWLRNDDNHSDAEEPPGILEKLAEEVRRGDG